MSREYEPRNFQSQITRTNADNTIIPSLGNGEKFTMTVAPFQDHGKPCFVGSAIKSHPVFLGLARSLIPEESRKANERFAMEVEKILDGNEARRVATWSAKDKPNIYMLFIGEPFDPRSLRLYYTRSEHNGVPAIYQLAIARLKDTAKVERVFENAGYHGSENWEKRKVH